MAGKAKTLRRLFLFFCMLLLTESHSFGFWFKPKWEDFQGGIHLVLEIESKGDPAVDEESTIRISQILKDRLKQMGIKKMIIERQGKKQIIVQIPKTSERVIEFIGSSFFLEFRVVDEGHSLEEALKGRVPPGGEILYDEKIDPGKGQPTKAPVPYLVRTDSYLTGKYITDARVEIDERDESYISIVFDQEGAKLFEEITGENIGKRLAVVLDKTVCSAPVISHRISGGRAQITGNFTIREAQVLAIALRRGSYPAPTKVIEYRELDRDIWLGNKNP
jgi:preprotein translocase subunit SecD